jgi:AraC-like DNA-binding protein
MPIAWDGPYCPYIHGCNDDRRPQPWRLPHRRLAHYVLVTSLDGPEAITVDGRAAAVPRGGSYLIAPGQLHDLSSPGNRVVWVHFDLRWDAKREEHPYAGAYEPELGRRAKFLQPSSREVYGVDLPVLAPEELGPELRAGMPRIIGSWQRGGPIGVLEATHQLAGLLLSWVGLVSRARGDDASDEARIARAEAVAARSLGSDFGVDQFAAVAGWSRSRFSAVFSRLRGLSPGDWLRRERMRSAAALLARPELTVAAVGALVGYADPTVFGRVFRAHHGKTPGGWRAGRG